MRWLWSASESALSWGTVLLALILCAYVIALQALGVLPSGAHASVSQIVLDAHLHAFVLGPLWFILCLIRSRRTAESAVLLRNGSPSRWLGGQMSMAAAEALQLIVALIVVSAVVVTAGTATVTGDDAIVIVGGVVLYVLFLVATRCLLAALTLLWGWGIGAGGMVVLVVLGAIAANETPVPAVIRALTWLTWIEPRFATEVSGVSYLGIIICPAVILLLELLVAFRSGGGSAAYALFQARTGALVLAGWILLQALMIWGAAAIDPINLPESFLAIYYGPPIDMLGVPILSVFLQLIVFFGVPVLMLRRFDEESGAWLDLTLIRSGSPRRWASGFLRRWLVISGGVLVIAPFTTVVAWLIVVDSFRASGAALEFEPLLLAYRYFVVGALQVAFYVLVAFTAAWIPRRATYGLVALIVMMIGGVLNPLFDGWLPVYLNGLARVVEGWPGAWKATVLLLASISVVLLILIVTLRRQNNHTLRRMTWRRSPLTM